MLPRIAVISSLISGLLIFTGSTALQETRPVYAVAQTTTFTTVGQTAFPVPAGVTTISVSARGAAGRPGCPSRIPGVPGGSPGFGGLIQVNNVTIPPGVTTLYVVVGNDGNSSSNGGGEAVSVQTLPITDVNSLASRLVVGAGGGGAGAGGCGSGPLAPGGNGGNGGPAGAEGGNGAAMGGGGGTQSAGGAGGAGGVGSAPGIAGSAGGGGSGGIPIMGPPDTSPGGGGGGGGAGYFGGGGGAAGRWNSPPSHAGSGGGGGGGSNFAAGGTIVSNGTAASALGGSVTLTVTTALPPTLNLPNLIVNMSGPTGGVIPGASSFYTITVTNAGTAGAVFGSPNIILYDNLPSFGLTYGGVSFVTSNVTSPGNISCTFLGPDLTCSATGPVIIQPTGSITLTVNFTVVIAQTYVNPRAGQLCKVDPGNPAAAVGNGVVVESSEGDNLCGPLSFDGLAPDLTAVKTNNVLGTTDVGTQWIWTINVRNGGGQIATFPQDSVIFRDDLPSANLTYGVVTVANPTILGGGGTVVCSAAPTVICTATGGAVNVGIPNGGFDIQIPVTATAAASFANPLLPGVCRADPNNVIDEKMSPGQTTTPVATPSTSPPGRQASPPTLESLRPTTGPSR